MSLYVGAGESPIVGGPCRLHRGVEQHKMKDTVTSQKEVIHQCDRSVMFGG